ncbi:unnamed protein product [Cochlearia groenlandica]
MPPKKNDPNTEDRTESLVRDVEAIQREISKIGTLEEGVNEIRQQMKALMAMMAGGTKNGDDVSQGDTPVSKENPSVVDGGYHDE